MSVSPLISHHLFVAAAARGHGPHAKRPVGPEARPKGIGASEVPLEVLSSWRSMPAKAVRTAATASCVAAR